MHRKDLLCLTRIYKVEIHSEEPLRHWFGTTTRKTMYSEAEQGEGKRAQQVVLYAIITQIVYVTV